MADLLPTVPTEASLGWKQFATVWTGDQRHREPTFLLGAARVRSSSVYFKNKHVLTSTIRTSSLKGIPSMRLMRSGIFSASVRSRSLPARIASVR
jgi:hypothetical protein